MILHSHPTGNNFFREAANGFEDADLLCELHLSIASAGNNIFSKAARLPTMSEIRRREYHGQLSNKVRLHPWREMGRLIASRIGLRSLTRHELGIFSVDQVYRAFDRAVAKRTRELTQKSSGKMRGVYCYEDGALETFKVARENNLTAFYDLPIAYWKTLRKLLEEERDRHPEWSRTLPGTRDSTEKYERKDQELELADAVVCPSQFVFDSIPESIRKKKPVEVIPFGSPSLTQPPNTLPRPNDGRLKVLFAGSMTQRKGLADLFSAIQMLDSDAVELHVLGSPVAEMGFYKSIFPDFIHHSPRPHTAVLKLMHTMDVFVLPSIVEGRALVQQEALSCGLPIIVTPNAGGQDLVEGEKAGFLVPIRSPESIAEKLRILQLNQDKLEEMKEAAIDKAKNLTWSTYRDQLTKLVKAVL